MKKLISKEEVLSFDDVILVPGYSYLRTRRNINASVDVNYNNKKLNFKKDKLIRV